MNKKGAVQAQLTAAYKTERETLCGRVQQEEPGRCRCRNRTRTGKLTPARHRWPCRCPSKRTVVGLSPAPSAGILHPESGWDKNNNKRRAVTTPRITPARVPLPHRVYRHAAAHLRGFLSSAKPLWGIPLSRQSRPRKHSPEAVRSAPPAAHWHISPRGVFLETIAATIADDMVIFPTRLHQLDRLLQRPCSNYKESRCAAGGEEEEEREEAGQQSEMLHPGVTSALPQSGKKSPRSSKVATYGSLFV